MNPAYGFVNPDGHLVVSNSAAVMGLDPTTGATIWETPDPDSGVGAKPTYSTETHILVGRVLMRQSDGVVVRSDLRTAAVDPSTNTAALTAGFNARFEIIDLDSEKTLYALGEDQVRDIDGVYVLGGFDGVFYVWTGASGLRRATAAASSSGCPHRPRRWPVRCHQRLRSQRRLAHFTQRRVTSSPRRTDACEVTQPDRGLVTDHGDRQAFPGTGVTALGDEEQRTGVLGCVPSSNDRSNVAMVSTPFSSPGNRSSAGTI